MYSIFEELLNKNGLKTSDVVKGTGLNATFFSEWKKGKSKNPNTKNLQKIADFFGVSIDYLMTGKEPKESKYSSEMALLVGKLRNDKAMSQALLKYFDLSDDKKKHIVDTINMLCEGK